MIAALFAVDLVFSAAVAVAFLMLVAPERPAERRLVTTLLAAGYLVKAVVILGVLPRWLRALDRWARAAPEQRDALMTIAAGRAAFGAPTTLGLALAGAWSAWFPSVTIALLWAFPDRLPLPVTSAVAAAVLLCATFFAGALALTHLLVWAILGPDTAELSLAARARGVTLPARAPSLRRRIGGIALCAGLAPVCWLAAAGVVWEARAGFHELAAVSRLAAAELAAKAERRAAGGTLETHDLSALVATATTDDRAAFLADADGTIRLGRSARTFVAGSPALRAELATAAGNAGEATDLRRRLTLAWRRIDGGRLVGVVARAGPPPTLPGSASTLVVFAGVALVYVILCAAFLAGAAPRPVGPITAVVDRLARAGAAEGADRAPCYAPDELGRLAEAVNGLADRLERSAGRTREAQAEIDRLARAAEDGRRLLTSVTDNVPVGVALLRLPDGVFELCNPALAALFPGTSLEGRRVAEVFPEAAVDLPEVERAMAAGEVYRRVDAPFHVRRRPLGPLEIASFTFSASPLMDAAGKRYAVLAVVHETTDQVAARRRIEALAGTAERHARELEAVFDNMVEGVFVCDPTGRLVTVNEAGLELLGLRDGDTTRPASELAALLEVRGPDGRPQPLDRLPLARALAGETVVGAEETVRHLRSGRDVRVRTNAAPIRDERGTIVGALEVAREITAD